MPTTPPTWSQGASINFEKPSRSVHTVFLHCSASDVASHDDVSVMRQWHLARGWSDVGYHFFINKNGNIQTGRPVALIPAAQAGLNTGTIAVCLHGLEVSKFTSLQFQSAVALCQAIDAAYTDRIRFRGHREVSSKACPVFNYRHVLGLSHEGYATSSPNTGGNAPPQPPPPPQTPSQPPVVENTLSGRDVKVVQAMLNHHGANLNLDGVFGQQTNAAVIQFQRQNGLTPDGSVGPKTRSMLLNVGLTRRGDRGHAVKGIQQLLNLRGKSLATDGIFGAGTEAVVKSFQRAQGLSADGIVGPKTFARMT